MIQSWYAATGLKSKTAVQNGGGRFQKGKKNQFGRDTTAQIPKSWEIQIHGNFRKFREPIRNYFFFSIE